ncbi:MAG TPA: hypothetical protein ENN76_03705 [Euryarchaeota archaeon]|nr:hypothetical protein [Euryarchaeota archaeon]
MDESEQISNFKKERDLSQDELKEEIRELNRRLAQMESMLLKLVNPVDYIDIPAKGYLKLVSLALQHGRISPDMLIPKIRDDISRAIVQTLVEKNGQNISQITESVKNARRTASRRIVRERLKKLESEHVVDVKKHGAIAHYYISEEVLKKWSRMLGIDI